MPRLTLDQFQVQPRSLAMFRAEQYANLPGTFTLKEADGARSVVNGTEAELRDAVIVDVGLGGSRATYLGRLAPKGAVDVKGDPVDAKEFAAMSPEGLKKNEVDPAPFLEMLVRSSVAGRPEEDGEVRLVAWVAKPQAGQTIEPAVDLHQGFTLVVAHLKVGPTPDPSSYTYNILARGPERPSQQMLNATPPTPVFLQNLMWPGRAGGASRGPRHPATTVRRDLAQGDDPRPDAGDARGADARAPPVPGPTGRPRPAPRHRHDPRRPRSGRCRLRSPAKMIEVQHFTKRYGDFVAVDDLSLSIGTGEVFGFIGPNGAGKSTTIRFLATLLRPTSGEGRVAGKSVTQDPMGVRRVIGYMPDDFGVYDGMKVWEFLDFFAVAYEIPRSYRKKIIGQVLELLDLTHKRDDYVNGLSKGMKQRLCLAKTLVHDPPVLILDEPASGLDPRARLEMKALLNELRGMGKTILVSSHILSELADFCTSIGVIERGRLLAAGSIADITRQLRQHRVLKVRVMDDSADRAAAILRDESNVKTVETFDHTITAEYHGDEEALAKLLGRLVSSGVGVHSFGEEELSLEEVFMMITKGIVN